MFAILFEIMTSEEKAQKIKEIYDEAVQKLAVLKEERKEIIKKYTSELEAQKIHAIRESLGLNTPQQ